MNKDKLKEIISNDPLNLLKLETKAENKTTESIDEKLIRSFEEITDFYEKFNHEPLFSKDISEYMLASRLKGIRNNPQKVKDLLPFDFYNLLKNEESKSITVEDLLGEDPLNLLTNDEDDSIYNLIHIKPSERIRPDYISRRTICKNFDEYEAIFTKIHNELKTGKRKLQLFKEDDLQTNHFFVLRGVLLFLEKKELSTKDEAFKSGARTRTDGRTHIIFDNGTESNMLYRSLYKALLNDGFTVSEEIIQNVEQTQIDDNDIQNGYIYVLRSLSNNPEIMKIKDLYKIGMCSGDVTERIKNAKNEPTYLMSDVEVILTVRCYNLNVLNLESNIHNFFNSVNMNFEVTDKDGNIHYPKEWYIVPLNIIEEAINYIIKGQDSVYFYNKELQMIVKK